MLDNADLFFLWALCTWLFYVGAPSPIARFHVLLVSSLGLVFTLAPWSMVLAVLVSVLGYACSRYYHPAVAVVAKLGESDVRFVAPLAAAFSFALFPLVFIIILSPLVATKLATATGLIAVESGKPAQHLIVTLGIGFYTLRTLATVIDCINQQTVVPFRQFLLLNTFFPIYSAGPVEPSRTFDLTSFESKVTTEDITYGLSRILIGLLKTFYLGDALLVGLIAVMWPSAPNDFASMSTAAIVGYILARFFYTYINFSGYMDIAVGISRCFGLRIMENFNYPFLASNVRNFWQRWHISLGRFVQTYIFFPLLITFKFSWA